MPSTAQSRPGADKNKHRDRCKQVGGPRPGAAAPPTMRARVGPALCPQPLACSPMLSTSVWGLLGLHSTLEGLSLGATLRLHHLILGAPVPRFPLLYADHDGPSPWGWELSLYSHQIPTHPLAALSPTVLDVHSLLPNRL